LDWAERQNHPPRQVVRDRLDCVSDNVIGQIDICEPQSAQHALGQLEGTEGTVVRSVEFAISLKVVLEQASRFGWTPLFTKLFSQRVQRDRRYDFFPCNSTHLIRIVFQCVNDATALESMTVHRRDEDWFGVFRPLRLIQSTRKSRYRVDAPGCFDFMSLCPNWTRTKAPALRSASTSSNRPALADELYDSPDSAWLATATSARKIRGST